MALGMIAVPLLGVVAPSRAKGINKELLEVYTAVRRPARALQGRSS